MADRLRLDSVLPLTLGASLSEAELREAKQHVMTRWEQLAEIDPRAFERAESDGAQRFRALIDHQLAQIADFARELMSRCDAQLEAHVGGVDAEARTALRALADVSFMALSETNAKRDELSRSVRLLTPLQALSSCGSALRRGRKALVSLDAALSRVLGTGPLIDGRARLAESLEIRRQYSVLRRATEADRPPTRGELGPRLKLFELRIALLREKAVYDQLRLDDRVELRVLQQRLSTWLSGNQDDTEGLRLWQDAVGFTQLLYQVNLRQELREHDALLVAEALALMAIDEHPTLSDAAWNVLKPLLGLHDTLDDLLRRNERDRAQCLAVLHVLSAGLRSDLPAPPEQEPPD